MLVDDNLNVRAPRQQHARATARATDQLTLAVHQLAQDAARSGAAGTDPAVHVDGPQLQHLIHFRDQNADSFFDGSSGCCPRFQWSGFM
ncbi:hypothetical protein D9M68_1005640 [compost metagenome]